MVQKYSARIESRKKLNDTTYEISFKLDGEGIDFLSGQYVWVIAPEGPYDEKGSRRAFSIINSPSDKKRIVVAFKDTKSVYKKNLIEASSNQNFTVEGPFGNFILPENEQNIVFVAGGTGITPYLSLLRDASEKRLSSKIHLIYASSKEDSFIYRKELSLLKRLNKNLSIEYVVGKINSQVLEANYKKRKDYLWYITGPEGLVNYSFNELKKLGLRNENFKFDQYYPNSLLGSLGKVSENVVERALLDIEKFKLAIESAMNHIVITDINGTIQYANNAAERLTGYSVSEMYGSTPRLWGGLMPKDTYKKFWHIIKEEKKPFEGEFTNRNKNGEIYTAKARVSPIISSGVLVGFIGTEEDITQIKNLNKMKDEFLSIASHELRTPMTAIKGFVSMILEKDYGEYPKSIKEPLDDIFSSTERLIRLVNDLLNISRIEAGRMKISLSNFNLSDVVSEVMDSLSPVAKDANLQLKYPKDFQGKVFADKDKVKQIVNNIVGNSLKFTDRGYIEASFKKDGDFIEVYIKDTGIGISRQDQKKLFGKFQQVSGVQNGRPQGTGLGLYISQTVARKMGGDLWLEKSDAGRGSTFAFKLLSSDSKKTEEIKKEIEKESKEHPDQKGME